MSPDEPSNWRQADLSYLAAIIQIVCDFLDHWGRRPTADEVRKLLQDH